MTEAVASLGLAVAALLVKAVVDSMKDRGTINNLHSLRNKANDALLRVAVVETRVDGVDAGLERIEGRIEKLHEKMDKLNDRLGAR